MSEVLETPYIVVLRDAPASLPADAKIAAEARYARELERALGGPQQVADTLNAVYALEGADVISSTDKKMVENWQKASTLARDRALAQIGEVEEAYFDVRTQ